MRAIYPGTFNPITNGHMNLVVRALKLFPKLTIAVAASEHKNPYFSLEKRLQLCKQALTEYPQVEVISFNDLLIECALREKATFIIRGLRGSVDFDYEQQMAAANQKLMPEIETLFLPATTDVGCISSSMVREILMVGGDVSAFVPKTIVKMLA